MSNFPSAIEAFELQRVAQAERQGFALFAIRGSDVSPPFVYSIGMAQRELPELLTFAPSDDFLDRSVAMTTQLCGAFVEGIDRGLDRIQLIRAFLHRPLIVRDPLVTYEVELLRDGDFTSALRGYLTRSTRYRERLGMPRGVLAIRHPEVPTFQRIRAAEALSMS